MKGINLEEKLLLLSSADNNKKAKRIYFKKKKRSRKEKEYSEYNMYIYKHISSMEISPLRALFPLLNFILFFFPPSPSTLNIHPKKKEKKKQ